MQCGTPVITSNVSSLPEIVGEKGVMVSPDDPIALCHAMQKLVLNTQYRSEMILYGLKRAKEFSWKKTAEMTWQVYEEVITK